jgi:hypothetical protein
MSDFWHPKIFEELASEPGMKPVERGRPKENLWRFLRR